MICYFTQYSKTPIYRGVLGKAAVCQGFYWPGKHDFLKMAALNRGFYCTLVFKLIVCYTIFGISNFCIDVTCQNKVLLLVENYHVSKQGLLTGWELSRVKTRPSNWLRSITCQNKAFLLAENYHVSKQGLLTGWELSRVKTMLDGGLDIVGKEQ